MHPRGGDNERPFRSGAETLSGAHCPEAVLSLPILHERSNMHGEPSHPWLSSAKCSANERHGLM